MGHEIVGDPGGLQDRISLTFSKSRWRCFTVIGTFDILFTVFKDCFERRYTSSAPKRQSRQVCSLSSDFFSTFRATDKKKNFPGVEVKQPVTPLPAYACCVISAVGP